MGCLPAVFRAPVRPDIVSLMHRTLLRTSASPTVCRSLLDIRHLLSPGVPAVLLLGSPVLGVAEPTGLDRLPSATCAGVDACSLPPSSGGDGTGRWGCPEEVRHVLCHCRHWS